MVASFKKFQDAELVKEAILSAEGFTGKSAIVLCNCQQTPYKGE
jgi:hypothetical protein